MITLDLQLDTHEVDALFDRMRERFEDMGRQMRHLDGSVASIVRKNFMTGGRPAWKRRKDRKGHPLLRKSGRLMRAAVNPVTVVQKSSILFQMRAGNIGAVHQYGVSAQASVGSYMRTSDTIFGKRVRRYRARIRPHKRRLKIPARPFFVIPAGEVSGLVAEIAQRLFS